MIRWGLLGCAAGGLLAQQGVPARKPIPRKPPGYYATLHTSMGPITFQLFEKESPITVANFTDLALGRKTYLDPRNSLPSRLPLFSGLTFHRVIPEFMIQGGDPLGDGTGATAVIPDETSSPLKFDVAGRVAMANSGPNSGSCQFFITEAPTPHLDGLHTIFGQVVDGLELVRKIARVDTEDTKPVTPVTIEKVIVARIQPVPATKPPIPPKKAATLAK